MSETLIMSKLYVSYWIICYFVARLIQLALKHLKSSKQQKKCLFNVGSHWTRNILWLNHIKTAKN